jgi:glycosyltransferase involved in cell wall biosynthesis
MRILIILCYDDYVRFYLKTGAFADLAREHDVQFVLSDACKTADQAVSMPGYAGIVKSDPSLEQLHMRLFDVLTWRYRGRSKTFRYRFSRQYRTMPNTSVSNVVTNLRGLSRAARFVALGNRVIGPRFVQRQIETIPINRDLERVLAELRPELVILPSTATEPIGNDLVRLSRTMGFRTLFLIDNWDNLSSKSLFWALPDYLGVWGEQAREHATKIHEIDAAKTFFLGTPRFEAYYSVERGKTQRHYEHPYILFVGSALAFDELSALHRIDDEIAAHPEIYGDLRVVYRPHPRRQTRLCPDEFHERDFRHVVLDKQLRDSYYGNDPEFQPSLDYYPSLLAEARLVVGPLTTMLLEALLCGTPVLAIAYDDKVHYTSPHNAYRHYMHFEGIERIAGMNIDRDADRLAAQLRELVNAPAPPRKTILDSLQYFLYRDERTYGRRLADAVREIATSRTR